MKKTYSVVDKRKGEQVNSLDYIPALRELKKRNYRATVQIRDNRGRYIGDGKTLKAQCKMLGI